MNPGCTLTSSHISLHSSRLINGDKVTVSVGGGTGKKTLNIPKALLCKASWFDRALQEGTFKEGATSHIELPEDSPHAFEAFQYYLYHDDLAFENVGDNEPLAIQQLELCCLVWVFGDKYAIPGLQNAAMLRACELLVKHDTTFPVDIMTKCYSSTTKGSPLRKLVADCVVQATQDSGADVACYERLASYGGFLEDVLSAQNAYHTGEKQWVFPRYLKPFKFTDIFFVAAEPAGIGAAIRKGYSNLAMHAQRGDTLCQECGIGEAEHRCADSSCQSKRTRCGCCGSEDIQRLCAKCVEG